MNKFQVNVSNVHDANVEPIALKLAHNKNSDNNVNTSLNNNNETENTTTTNTMWWILLSCIFILVIMFVVVYFVLNRYNVYNNQRFDDDFIDEEYGEL